MFFFLITTYPSTLSLAPTIIYSDNYKSSFYFSGIWNICFFQILYKFTTLCKIICGLMKFLCWSQSTILKICSSLLHSFTLLSITYANISYAFLTLFHNWTQLTRLNPLGVLLKLKTSHFWTICWCLSLSHLWWVDDTREWVWCLRFIHCDTPFHIMNRGESCARWEAFPLRPFIFL